MQEEEKWVELEAYGADSETAAALRDKLCEPSTDGLPFHMAGGDYLASIVPGSGQVLTTR